MTQRTPCLLSAFLVAALQAASATLAPAAERPNVVVIMADDLGYADLSCFGNDRFETPHLDALAREGLRFTDFHSNGAVCSPTRAALLTGRYQQRAGITEVIFADPARGRREHGLQAGELTFAALLKDAGYRTALFGKWHLGYQPRYNPVRHGFDEFRGFVSGNVDYHSHVDQAGFADWWVGLQLRDEPGYTTHLINRHAVRFIEENRGRPFCLYVAHEAPHSPYQGPNDPPLRSVGNVPRERPAPERVARAYREMVQEVDTGAGQIVETLRRLGLERRTLVFFCSDNGGTAASNNGPLTGTKGSLWEGGHRVPAIAWWPGRIEAGRITGETALTMDLWPTMLDLAGVTPPAGHQFDGVSLVPLLDGRPLAARAGRTLFWGYLDRYAVREGPWKLLVNQARPGGRPRGAGGRGAEDGVALFHLGDDLAERTDLSAKHPDRVRRLQAELARWQADVARGATAQPQ